MTNQKSIAFIMIAKPPRRTAVAQIIIRETNRIPIFSGITRPKTIRLSNSSGSASAIPGLDCIGGFDEWGAPGVAVVVMVVVVVVEVGWGFLMPLVADARDVRESSMLML